LPYVPGSYVAKGAKLVGKVDEVADVAKALSKVDNIADAASVFKKNKGSIIMGYKELKRTLKSLKISDLGVHHLIEKRFAPTLGLNADDILSVALDKNLHKQITQEFRNKIGYNIIDVFRNDVRTGNATPQQIWDAIKDVYTKFDMEKYLDPIKEQISAAAKKKGYFIDFSK